MLWSANLDAKAETVVSFILAAPGLGTPAVYLVPEGDGWALPHVALPLPAGVSFSTPAITAAVRASLGVDTELLLIESGLWPAAVESVVMLAALPASPPATGPVQRVALADARRATWACPDHLALLTVLDEPAPPQRVAWARPGFLAEATAWITAELAGQGVTVTSPLDVRRNWSLSCLLRVPTSAGDHYFKAIPALFGQEPALTRDLARRFPGRVPAVAAIDPDRHWLLMRAFAGPPLAETTVAETWLAALQGYAELQVAFLPHTADLLALGCPDRSVNRLEAQVADLLADTAGMRIDQTQGLSAAEATRLLALGPALRQACRAFAALNLPPSLEHGDLHSNNIALAPGGGFVYYDWSDGCLAPPFFGLSAFLENAPAHLHPALTAVYTSPWRTYADEAALQRARRLARPLSDLHLALSYAWIRAQTEPRQHWQLAGSLPYFLRELLNHWAEVEPHL